MAKDAEKRSREPKPSDSHARAGRQGTKAQRVVRAALFLVWLSATLPLIGWFFFTQAVNAVVGRGTPHEVAVRGVLIAFGIFFVATAFAYFLWKQRLQRRLDEESKDTFLLDLAEKRWTSEEGLHATLWIRYRQTLLKAASGMLVATLILFVHSWFMRSMFDAAPSANFFFVDEPWQLILVLFVLVVVLPRIVLYVLLGGFILMWVGFAALGPQIIFWLPNFIMLPFFYGFMMVFLYGSIAAPNFTRIKIMWPGSAKLGVCLDDVRGQPVAMKQARQWLMKIRAVGAMLEGKGMRYGINAALEKPSRGALFFGPPGVGKTYLAKAIANEERAVFFQLDGSIFQATFVGIGPLIAVGLFWVAEKISYLIPVFVFIDEAENAFQRRPGMAPSHTPVVHERPTLFGSFPVDQRGAISDCGLTFTTREVVEQVYLQKHPTLERRDPVIIGGFGGLGGAGSPVLPVFLTKIDGVDTPPLKDRIIRKKVNELLDATFLPPTIPYARLLKALTRVLVRWTPLAWSKKATQFVERDLEGRKYIILRLPGGKPRKANVFYILATNRPDMLDPALTRSGRIDEHIEFTIPIGDDLVDVLEKYGREMAASGKLDPAILEPQNLKALARRAQGFSPADAEKAMRRAPMQRRIRSMEALRIADELRAHLPPNVETSEEAIRNAVDITPLALEDQLFFNRRTDEVLRLLRFRLVEERRARGQELSTAEVAFLEENGQELGDYMTDVADWDAINEYLTDQSSGFVQPARMSEAQLAKTADHEAAHAVMLAWVMGSDWYPTYFSAIPRSHGQNGFISWDRLHPMDPEFYELFQGMLRISLASNVGERLLYGRNGPGVGGDAINAARTAAGIVGLMAMEPYPINSGDERRDREIRKAYIEKGKALLSLGEVVRLGDASPVGRVLSNQHKLENAYQLIGHAWYDAARVLKKHLHVVKAVSAEIRRRGELSGQPLHALWRWMITEMEPLTLEELHDLEGRSLIPKRSFRGPDGSEITGWIDEELERRLQEWSLDLSPEMFYHDAEKMRTMWRKKLEAIEEVAR